MFVRKLTISPQGQITDVVFKEGHVFGRNTLNSVRNFLSLMREMAELKKQSIPPKPFSPKVVAIKYFREDYDLSLSQAKWLIDLMWEESAIVQQFGVSVRVTVEDVEERPALDERFALNA